MNLGRLVERLKEEEGYRSHVYFDTTGNLTIGYGHNLGKLEAPEGVDFSAFLRAIRVTPVNGVTPTIAEALLINVLTDTLSKLRKALPWVDKLDETRQQIIGDMAFNMGVPGLLKWPIFLGQVQRGEYQAAARNMRSTAWFRQVGHRAVRLVYMMEHGEEPQK